MALIETATAANRVVETALSVVYSRRRIHGSWTSVSGNVTTTHTVAWEYTRHAVKSYRYVGMTEAVAKSTAAALVAYYRRSAYESEFDTETGSQTYGSFKTVAAGDTPMAEVAAVHEGTSHMWSVHVNVDELDTRLDLSPERSFASLFAIENTRLYDDGENAAIDDE